MLHKIILAVNLMVNPTMCRTCLSNRAELAKSPISLWET